MPVLETLTLRNFIVKLMDLEIAHRNVPSIKSLRLKGATMLSGEIPQDVIPASLITEADLELDWVHDLDTHIQFYKYVGKKYPSVSKPSYDRTVQEFDSCNDTYMRRLYNERIIPLYQNIRPQIDTFYFTVYCRGLNAFRKFDNAGIQLKELGVQYPHDDGPLFLDELAQSKQPKYIQKLTLRDIDPSPLEMMTKMEALTFLEINFVETMVSNGGGSTNKIDFNLFVEVCPPNLKYLIIKCMRLDFSGRRSNATSIQYLKLETVKFLSRAAIREVNFPKLKALYVNAVTKNHLEIPLPNQHLKVVDMEIQYPMFADCTITVNTMNEGRPQRKVVWPGYIGDSGQRVYPSRDPNFYFMEEKLVELTCASVEKSSYFIYSELSEEEGIFGDDEDNYY